jgi:hypothetical protein
MYSIHPYNLNNIPGFNEIMKNEIPNNVLTCNVCHTENSQYKIIRYEKFLLSTDIYHNVGLLRSAIVNKNNALVSFSPPKSYPLDIFMNSYIIDGKRNEYIVAEEFVEGTMINVFWDPCIGLSGSWEIATRNTVGANVSFFKQTKAVMKPKTFREMFLEALSYNNLDLNLLSKNYTYSFVLQHKENRIVVPFTKPQLYLVAVYHIVTAENGFFVNPIGLQGLKTSLQPHTSIKFPKIYNEWETIEDLKHKFASMNTDFRTVGVVIRNILTGERTKIRNPVYESIRRLRGIQPKLQYQYLILRKEARQIATFLSYYPEYKKDFSVFRDSLHNFTNALFANYISCYIKKERPLGEFGEQYKTHMFYIHQKYIEVLKPQGQYVTKHVVIDYVNKLHPKLQMHSLNYAFRKRSSEFDHVEEKETHEMTNDEYNDVTNYESWD